MKALSVFVQSCEVSRKQPFVYAVYSSEFDVVYIGETCSYLGALGRLSQHLSRNENATFRNRVCKVFGYEEVKLCDVRLFAVPLKQDRLFSIPDYRRAVECSVQRAVMDRFTKTKGPRIISRVNGNSYCADSRVKKEAKRVVKEILDQVQVC